MGLRDAHGHESQSPTCVATHKFVCNCVRPEPVEGRIIWASTGSARRAISRALAGTAPGGVTRGHADHAGKVHQARAITTPAPKAAFYDQHLSRPWTIADADFAEHTLLYRIHLLGDCDLHLFDQQTLFAGDRLSLSLEGC